MREHADLILRFSTNRTGEEKNLGRVLNVKWSWAELVDKLTKNIPRDRLTIDEYRRLNVDQQGARKNNGWFVGGQFKGGIRKKLFIDRRQIITLDIDEGTREIATRLEAGNVFGEIEYVVHSTRSHGKGKVKLHVVIPLRQAIDLDQWQAATRILAQKIDANMMMVDLVSFSPAQVMYWPSTCRDVEPVVIHQRGPLLDVVALLEDYEPGWRDISLLPRSPREKELRPEQVGTPPTEKRGWVGAWCRKYDCREAIAEFLSDIYRPSEGPLHAPDRYTYIPGKGTNGAVIYDNGQKLQSNHGSDPAYGQNNSWDLSQKHLFGDLDTPGDAEKDPTKQKSYMAMVRMCREDPRLEDVRRELMESNYGTDEEGVADAMDVGEAAVSDALEAPRTAPAVPRSSSAEKARRPDVAQAGAGAGTGERGWK